MDNKYYIYCYTNKINNKKYIGQTKRTQYERSGKNGCKYKNCPAFWQAIQKYGWLNFNYQVLKENLTLEEANYWEEYYISFYHTWIDDPKNAGYNLAKGGYNREHSQETLEKIRKSHLKENLSQETLEKMSNAAKQRYIDNPELKENFRKKWLGKKLSKEQKEKMSKAQKERFSKEEELQKRSELSKKKVLCVENQKIYNSISEAAKDVGLLSGCDIGRVCSGKKRLPVDTIGNIIILNNL